MNAEITWTRVNINNTSAVHLLAVPKNSGTHARPLPMDHLCAIEELEISEHREGSLIRVEVPYLDCAYYFLRIEKGTLPRVLEMNAHAVVLGSQEQEGNFIYFSAP